MTDGVLATLRADETTSAWFEHIETADLDGPEIALPSLAELSTALPKLKIPEEDIAILLELHSEVATSDDWMWLFHRCTRELSNAMGRLDHPPRFPTLPESLGTIHRYFFIYVFMALLPEARTYHLAHDVPDEVSWATFADLGRHLKRHRRSYGIGGLNVPFWFMLHFRGCIYELGRLQFDRGRLGQQTGEAIANAGFPYGPTDFALGVHIPEMHGPMSPARCDASFAWAREFYPRHFPDEDYKIATCHSWLLDPQLAEYLPADSNIVQFQRRFHLAFLSEPNPSGILYFIFGQRTPDLDSLPQNTTLERAIVGHLKAGHTWHSGAGWLEL